MSRKVINLIQWVLIIIFDTSNQLFMKLLGNGLNDISFGLEWLHKAALIPYLWAAILCDILSFLVWILILKRSHFSFAVPASSVCYITILFFSWVLFNETINAGKITGIIFIVAGLIMISNLNEEKKS